MAVLGTRWNEMDAVLGSASLKGDSYSRVMTLLKEYKLASLLAGEVERLKHQLSLLSNSVTTPESDKFIEIETQANIIKESVDKILKQIPFRVSGISKKK